ncbi:MAG: glutathione S-transferase [Rhodospirillaceae bacterium]|nr:glutathione S-transferase [Rhodospirillaceae bacterium]
MQLDNRYRLIGANGSPYSVKMRALMRYRRLPFDWVIRTASIREEIAHIRPALVPVLNYPDGSYRNDSTALVHDLEQRHPGERSVMPPDPALAFLANLIEDMADEWLTKAMFHYRWHYAPDQDFAARWISNDSFSDLEFPARREMAATFKARQISRMALVGCTPENKPVIEQSYHAVLNALDARVDGQRYLFGSRPSIAEFGLFGQLRVLADDPTPMSVMRDTAGDLVDWVRFMDDASGVDGEWQSPDAPLTPAVQDLLKLCANAYLPFLAANASALQAENEAFEVEIFGQPYRQAPFGYQLKCWNGLLDGFAKLEGPTRARAEAALAESGCLTYLTSSF